SRRLHQRQRRGLQDRAAYDQQRKAGECVVFKDVPRRSVAIAPLQERRKPRAFLPKTLVGTTSAARFPGHSHTPPSPGNARMTTRKHIAALAICLLATACTGEAPSPEAHATAAPALQRAGQPIDPLKTAGHITAARVAAIT